MIFTDENGKIYEVPNERYAEFEVSGQRASEINEELKQFVSNNSDNNEVSGYMGNNSDNNEVSGYMGGMYCSGLGPNRQVRKGATCENFWGGSVQYDGKKWSRI